MTRAPGTDEPHHDPSEVGPYSRSTTTDDDARVHVAQRPLEGYGVPVPYDVERGAWCVWLPHDCDEWVIGTGSSEHVAEQVELLIESLTEALNVLRGRMTP